MIPAAFLARTSSLPSLRSPARAARTLCACQPVALVRSPIGAPLGRCSSARMVAFFDGRTEAAGVPAGMERDEAAVIGRCFGLVDLAGLRLVLRGVSLATVALRDFPL